MGFCFESQTFCLHLGPDNLDHFTVKTASLLFTLSMIVYNLVCILDYPYSGLYTISQENISGERLLNVKT